MKKILTILSFGVLLFGVVGFIGCDAPYSNSDFIKGENPDNPDNPDNGYDYSTDNKEYVDLGLPSGTLWATCNIGASSSGDYGHYFAWGETKPKGAYNWLSYIFGTDKSQLTKYCSVADYGKDGYVDSKYTLDLEDDAAYINWGSDWRMPTAEEVAELVESCSWTWCIVDGKIGCKGMGTNGNTIFFPAAGRYDGGSLWHTGEYGYYWVSSLFQNQPDCSESFFFHAEEIWAYSCWGRFFGFPIRAIKR